MLLSKLVFTNATIQQNHRSYEFTGKRKTISARLHNIFQFSTNLISHLPDLYIFCIIFTYLYKCVILHIQTQRSAWLRTHGSDGTSLISSTERYLIIFIDIKWNYAYSSAITNLRQFKMLTSSWTIHSPDIRSVNSIPRRHR